MPHPVPSRLPRRVPGAIAAAAALLAVSAGAGLAQDDEPLRLTPIEVDEPAGPTPGTDVLNPAPVAATPDAGAEPSARAEEDGLPEPAGAEQDDGGIEVGALDALDPDVAGVVLPGIAPFAPDMWAGSRRSRIEALLPRLPVTTPSAAMRRLALALLTSPAHPPAGGGERGALALARVERLAAMGRRDLALALLERAGPPGGKEAIDRIRNERQLAALDYDGACEGIASKAGRIADGHWRRVRILCQAQAGLIEAATLSLDLLQESDAAPDPAFDSTIYALAGLAEPAVEEDVQATPLRVAAWRLAQIPIPVEAVAGAPPDAWPTIAAAPESTPLVRLLAAQHAEETGVLSIEELRSVYRDIAFSSDEIADALGHVESLDWRLRPALLLQAIEAQTSPSLRAELLAAALSRARVEGNYPTTARVLAHLVRTVPPTDEHGWFSDFAGRALMAAGDGERAAAWYALADRLAPGNADAALAAQRLWPLLLLSGDADRPTAADFDAWLTFHEREEGYRSYLVKQSNLLLLLLDALGTRIEPETWDRVLAYEHEQGAWEPAPVLDRVLREAAGEGRFGETVLMALLLLGEGGPERAGVAVVETVVSGLVSLGLEEEARAIALEAALGSGL